MDFRKLSAGEICIKDSLRYNVDMNIKSKFVTIVLFIFIASAIIYGCLFLFTPEISAWLYSRQDHYGGGLPEGTYQSFIEYVRMGDIDSITKFYQKQELAKERYEKIQQEGRFEGLVKRMPQWGEFIEKATYQEEWIRIYECRRFTSEYFMRPNEDEHRKGSSCGEIIFILDQKAKIWKIASFKLFLDGNILEL